MDIKKLKIGDKAPEIVNVVIEIPKDSNIKYELDKESGFVFVDRFLHTAMNYPSNYGFIPNTLADDGDPVDVLVLSQYAVGPTSVIKTKIIGVLQMEDEAGMDEKLLGVPDSKIDPVFGEYNDISDVPDAIKNRIKHFFENYKTLEPNKWVKVKSWLSKTEAYEVIKKGILGK